MVTQELTAPFTAAELEAPANSHQQYALQQARFRAQPVRVQQTLQIQARLMGKGIEDCRSPIYFVLPEQIACEVEGSGQFRLESVPAVQREHKVGDLLGLLRISDLDRHLATLEAAANPAVSTGAALLRFSTAINLAQSAMAGGPWDKPVFDENHNLLVNSLDEAKARIFAMHHSMEMLEQGLALAPYIVADSEFRQKRFSLYRQLTGQGRALAHYELGEIIGVIRRRAEAHTLNRGFKLGLPYFDDLDLEMKVHEFEVIPTGRVAFDPLFVVWAARYQQAEMRNQKKMRPSTCSHLIDLLSVLEKAFDQSGRDNRNFREQI